MCIRDINKLNELSNWANKELSTIKIQSYYRMFKVMKRVRPRNKELVVKKGIRLGKEHHMIHIAMDSEKALEICSNRAKNKLQVKLCDITKKALYSQVKNDQTEIKKLLKANIESMLRFDHANNAITFNPILQKRINNMSTQQVHS
eukprot:TRINITY_DN15749_c0_g1_i4.p2 TRINITY_DN15749_c0_g1~~TRINITY_DN15749_c0_g1_i4.p2  ORF type:complete len:146 (+),score=29.55 TRINITY_DN15749_c0_g1_i4:88-525(+)